MIVVSVRGIMKLWTAKEIAMVTIWTVWDAQTQMPITMRKTIPLMMVAVFWALKLFPFMMYHRIKGDMYLSTGPPIAWMQLHQQIQVKITTAINIILTLRAVL